MSIVVNSSEIFGCSPGSQVEASKEAFQALMDLPEDEKAGGYGWLWCDLMVSGGDLWKAPKNL